LERPITPDDLAALLSERASALQTLSKSRRLGS
jgi:hypothetical protein